MLWEVAIIVVLVLINGVLAGGEIAIIALRQSRLAALVAGGSAAAVAVKTLLDHPERFLATIQIGITVTSATAGAFGGASFAKDFAVVLRRIPALEAQAEGIALAIVVTLVSYLSLVLGELVPKSLALKAAEPYALLIGRPLVWFAAISRPLVWILTVSSNSILRIFGDRTSFTEARLSTEELRALVDEALKAGSLNRHAGEIASRALVFGDLTASDVMVPKVKCTSLSLEAAPNQIRQVLLENLHSRYPVFDQHVDRIIGYVATKDILLVAWDEALFVLKDLVRPAYFVRAAMKAVDVMNEMKTRHVPFAIVVDDRSLMIGLITIEDLVEELVGEIMNEDAALAKSRISIRTN